MIIWCDPCATCAAPDLTPAFARLTNGWCVDHGKELLHVFCQEPIEECLVAILQRGESDVALKRILLPTNLLQLYGDLLFKCEHRGGEEPIQAEKAPLFATEGGVLVQRGAAQ